MTHRGPFQPLLFCDSVAWSRPRAAAVAGAATCASVMPHGWDRQRSSVNCDNVRVLNPGVGVCCAELCKRASCCTGVQRWVLPRAGGFASALWFKSKSCVKQSDELWFCRQRGVTQPPRSAEVWPAGFICLALKEGPSATACRSDTSTGNHPVAKAQLQAKPVGLFILSFPE